MLEPIPTLRRPCRRRGDGRLLRYPLVAGIALLLHLSGRLSAAADLKGNFEIYGPGTKTCGTYTTIYPLRQTDAPPLFADTVYDEIRSWVLGYLSMYNEKTDRLNSILGNSDPNAVGAWLYNYCQLHPLESVHDAMQPLIVALYPRRFKIKP